MPLDESLEEMGQLYRADPAKAVRGQAFIKVLHKHIIEELDGRMTTVARKRGVRVLPEVTVFGSHKTKDVDVGVIDPHNGPLILVGIRSQMSSVGKNALNYYEGIVGECISLQDRFPMTTLGYVYLMPLKPIMVGKEKEKIDHARYARMYRQITGRSGPDYRSLRGVYDEFAYLVVDFDNQPPVIRDDLVAAAVPDVDLSIRTLVDRLVSKHRDRYLFVDDFT